MLSAWPKNLANSSSQRSFTESEAWCWWRKKKIQEAEGSFQSAIEIARKQRAKMWELRATTSLARLLRDTNRRDEARQMLAEILRLVHRGIRHRRPEGRQGVARRLERFAVNPRFNSGPKFDSKPSIGSCLTASGSYSSCSAAL